MQQVCYLVCGAWRIGPAKHFEALLDRVNDPSEDSGNPNRAINNESLLKKQKKMNLSNYRQMASTDYGMKGRHQQSRGTYYNYIISPLLQCPMGQICCSALKYFLSTGYCRDENCST